MTTPDFKIVFKFSPDKKWAVIDIETAAPFTGVYLAELLKNLASNLEQEPELNDQPVQQSVPDAIGIRKDDGDGTTISDAESDDSKYCGAV